MDTLAIIKRIELRLAELGMSKADFYRLSGISSASYSQWYTGKYKPSESKLLCETSERSDYTDYLDESDRYIKCHYNKLSAETRRYMAAIMKAALEDNDQKTINL